MTIAIFHVHVVAFIENLIVLFVRLFGLVKSHQTQHKRDQTMKMILAIINGIPERLPYQAVDLASIERAVRLHCIDRCTNYRQADVMVPDWPNQGSRAEKLRGHERFVLLYDNSAEPTGLTDG